MNQIRQRIVDINVPPIRDISVSSVVLLCLRRTCVLALRALAYPNQSVSKLMYPQDQVDVVQNAMECEQSQNPPSQKVMPTSRIITRILSTRCKEAFLKQAPRATTSPGFVLDMSTNNWTDAFGGVQAAQEASEITRGVGGYQNRLPSSARKRR